MQCPSCNGEVQDRDWLCPFCDHILDASVLDAEDEDENEFSSARAERTRIVAWQPRLEGDSLPPDAMILGDVDVNEEDFSVVQGPAAAPSGKTATFLFYTSSATSRVVHPDAVPKLTRSPSSITGTPYEDFVLALIDGKQSVRAIQRVSGLAPEEVAITILTLLDKGAIFFDRNDSSAGPRRKQEPARTSRRMLEEGEDDELQLGSEVDDDFNGSARSADDARDDAEPTGPAEDDDERERDTGEDDARTLTPNIGVAEDELEDHEPEIREVEAQAERRPRGRENAEKAEALRGARALAADEPSGLTRARKPRSKTSAPRRSSSTRFREQPVDPSEFGPESESITDPGSPSPVTKAAFEDRATEELGAFDGQPPKSPARRGSGARARVSDRDVPKAVARDPAESGQIAKPTPAAEDEQPALGEPAGRAPSDGFDKPEKSGWHRLNNPKVKAERAETKAKREPSVRAPRIGLGREATQDPPPVETPASPAARQDPARPDKPLVPPVDSPTRPASGHTIPPELGAEFLVELPKSVVAEVPRLTPSSPPTERPREEGSPPPKAMRPEPKPARASTSTEEIASPSPISRNTPPPSLPKSSASPPPASMSSSPPPPVRETRGEETKRPKAETHDNKRKLEEEPAQRGSGRTSEPPVAATGRDATSTPPAAKKEARATGIDGVRMTKAQKLFDEALKDKAEGNMVSARMNMKLALTFDPANELYQKAFDELSKNSGGASAPVVGKSRAREFYDAATQAEELGEVDRAIELLEKALNEAREPAFYNRLGVLIAMKKRDFARAQKLIETAIDLAPGNSTYQHNLAKVLSMEATHAVRGTRNNEGKKSGLLSFLGRKR